MKDHNQAAMQFSGYPLSIAELKQKSKQESKLSVVRQSVNDQTTAVQNNLITNDPKNWDLNWFNNYE